LRTIRVRGAQAWVADLNQEATMDRDKAEKDEGRGASAKTRRTILLGGAAGLAGLVADSLLSAQPADAANGQGQPVLLGEAGSNANTATSTTQINTTSGDGLQANTSGDAGSHGVRASATKGTGVYGASVSGTGVQGQTSADGQSGASGIDTSTGGGHGTFGRSTNGVGAYGTGPTGVYGTGGIGVYGTGNFGVCGSAPSQTQGSALPFGTEGEIAVFGIIGTGGPNINTISAGVEGFDVSTGTPAVGVFGNSLLGVGVQGHGHVSGVVGIGANFQDLPTLDMPNSYGVYGLDANFDTNQASDPTFAVYGSSGEGTGCYGQTLGDGQPGVYGSDQSTTGGFGVLGVSSNGGVGLAGTSNTGVGVAATSTSGTALQVDGKVAFSRSGLAALGAGKTKVTVTLAGVTTSSMVIATLQTDAGTVAVANAVPGAGKFTINLTAAPTSAVKVAWFVLG
jgi:hypothetical protein